MRLVLALLPVLVGTAPVTHAAPRAKGKVVRIERARTAAAAPRVCEVRSGVEATCLGPEPRVGEIISVLTETEVVAETRILEVAPFANGKAACAGVLWSIKSEVVRGSAGSIRGIGAVDRELDRLRARILARDAFPASPSGGADDVISVAIDRDGDRAADIVIVQTTCDGAANEPTCVEEWARVNGTLVRVQHTNFADCS